MMLKTDSEKQGMIPRMLTVSQAARYIGLSKRTLYDRLAPSAKKPFPINGKRIGGALRIDRKELDDYLDSI